tara:strand:- start:173 stop:385 length:213 start_codon:yes stop_codon:yes gene_type:complete
MIVFVDSIAYLGSIVQMIGRGEENTLEIINFDHRMFSHFVEANPTITFPGPIEWDRDNNTVSPVGEVSDA